MTRALDIETDVDVALRAARAGVDSVRQGIGIRPDAEFKGVVDPVTQIDLNAESTIREVLRNDLPNDNILAEEGGGADWRSSRVWIVDPLDGTVNFIHGVPHVAVSVALWDRGEPVVGVVIDVARGEEFLAVAGEGATLNDKKIRVSTTPNLGDTIIATGFPYDRQDHADSYAASLTQVVKVCRGVRVMGCASLDLAWVACGRFDAYWEFGGPHGLKPWDVAAGIVLVREAGGAVTDHLGKQNRLVSPATIASNGKVHEELRAIVAGSLPEFLA